MTTTQHTSAPAGRPSKGYMPGLDGARAVAIVMVVLAHITPGFFYGGVLGVDMFFVLSGFLITGILYREMQRTGEIRLKRFYLRRFMRLYPEMLVVVAIMAPIALFVLSRPKDIVLETISVLTYTTGIVSEISDWQGLRIWAHTWTLTLEELFYLIWPLMLIVGLRYAWIRRHAAAVALTGGLIVLVAGFVLAVTGTPDPSTFFRMGAMAIGGGVAMLPSRAWFAQTWVGVAGVLVFAGAAAAATWETVIPIGATFLPAAVGSLLLVAHLGTAETGPVVRAFSWRPAAYVGRISYGWYLWHWPLCVLTVVLMGDDNRWLAALVWIPLSFALAATTSKLIAGPREWLKERVS